MATFKQDISKPFSRRLNGLCEVQRWWPSFIKNDGVGGLTVDPVLFFTTFNKDLKEKIGDGLDDEARTAGIRVEILNTDGTAVSGDPQIEIAGSGTMDARAILTHEDGTKTEFRFVAPSADVRLANVYGSQEKAGAGGMEQGSDSSPDMPTMDYSAGPYPVFITLQEFTNWLDGITNRVDKALVDSLGGTLQDGFYKKAWLPHGIEGDGTIPSTGSYPLAELDPRISTDNNDPLPAISKIMATMFMPLLYDNNQLDSTQGSGDSTDIVQGAWDASASASNETGIGNSQTYYNFYDAGMTRYSQQPEDSPNYKWWDDSGDHRKGGYANIQRTDPILNPDNQFDYVNWDISPDSSAAGNPKWRYRSPLACFLADGIYKLKEGCIIPYVYDEDRTVGGKDGTTVYACWNGQGGIAATQTQLDEAETNMLSSAQIFPLYDFIQGPLCPPAQSWNWDYDVSNNWANWIARTTETRANLIDFNNGDFPDGQNDFIHEATMRWQPRSGLVRPNPIRAKIYAAQQVGRSTGTNTITTDTSAVGVLEIWVEDTTGGFGTVSSPKNVWKAGMPVNLYFGSGAFQEQVNVQGDPNIRQLMGTGRNTASVGSTGFPNGFPDIRQMVIPRVGETTINANSGSYSGRSGWWICNKVEALNAVNKNTIVPTATGTFTGHKLSFVLNGTNEESASLYIESVQPYELQKSWICQGIMGGAEVAFGGKLTQQSTTSDWQTWSHETLNTNGTSPYDPPSGPLAGQGVRYGLGSRKGLGMNKYNIIPAGGTGVGSVSGLGDDIGLGFVGGICGATNVPAYANQQWRFPNAVCFDPEPAFFSELNGFIPEADVAAPKGITIRSGDNDPFIAVPTANSFSGNILRLAAPQTIGHANSYNSISVPTMLTTGTFILAGDFVFGSGDNFLPTTTDAGVQNESQTYASKQGKTRWIQKSLVMLMQSAYDQASGNHSFDYIKPSLFKNGRNSVWPVHERVGTKWGYGNFVEIQGGWLEANKDRIYDPRYFKGETTATSLTEVGCSPVWLDMELSAWIPMRKERLVLIDFDTNVPEGIFGRHTHSISVDDAGLRVGYQAGFTFEKTGGVRSEWSSWKSVGYSANQSQHAWNTNLWFFQGSDVLANTAFDAATNGGWTSWASWPFAGQGNTGFGQMGNQIGTGATPFTIAEGYHNVRTIFEESGMTLLIDGVNKGKDLNSNNPVWGFSIVAANLSMGAPNREPSLPIYTTNNMPIWWGGHAVAKDDADLQIDSIRLRHIPTPAMLPFTVDTVNQKITGVSRYTALTVEAENINLTKGMNIKVSICPVVDNVPAPSTGISLRQVEGGTPYENFDNLSLDFVGGFGSVDLTLLPADAITNGFVIRFNFYVPSSADSDLHPIDWSKTPIIRSWSLEHDLAPTSTLDVVGNTFNGDTTPPIDTKVGHIVSFVGSGTTTDEDRVLTHFKFDFGDGVITEFLPLSDQTLQSASINTAHSYLTNGTYQATCTVKDDAGNEGVSSQVQIVVANAPPVAVLKSIPSLTRAGTAITLDGTDSFDINAGGSITNYTFTFGDGSNAVSGSAGTVQHTYATAGEYRATLVCTDADGATSQTASAVIKVLPATLVIPLVFNVKPAAFARTRAATMNQTQVLDATYPELTDTGQRTDEMQLTGMFLHSTANADIAFVEECMLAGSLVEFLYEDVDYDGVASGKSFVGRITAFDYDREGALDGQTPYSITLVREAGLGV